jgi:hypothetical protein
MPVPDAVEMRPDARRVSVPLMLRHTVAKQVPDQRVRVRLAKGGVSGSESRLLPSSGRVARTATLAGWAVRLGFEGSGRFMFRPSQGFEVVTQPAGSSTRRCDGAQTWAAWGSPKIAT